MRLTTGVNQNLTGGHILIDAFTSRQIVNQQQVPHHFASQFFPLHKFFIADKGLRQLVYHAI